MTVLGTIKSTAQPRADAAAAGVRILITSAGRRVELLGCFRAAAADLGITAEIFACDLRPALSPACQCADAAFTAPPVAGPGYVEWLLECCLRYGIDLVVPTIDPELLPLAHARERFAAIGTAVAVSSPALVDFARDKLATAEHLSAHGVRTPRTATLEDMAAAPGDWAWPLLVKPRHGSAGRNVRILSHPRAIADVAAAEPMVAQELLLPPEHTVNLYFDAAGTLRCAVPHERLQVRAGEVEKGITRRSPELAALAQQLAAALPGPRGALCFQIMQTADGAPAVLEINARFGGGYPLAHRAGATFTRWLIEDRLGIAATAHDDWAADTLMLRYDAAVFIAP